jgi:hypothetical protein
MKKSDFIYFVNSGSEFNNFLSFGETTNDYKEKGRLDG